MHQSQAALVELLNHAMQVEYGALFALPQYTAVIENEPLKHQLQIIARAELRHAEKTAQLIHSLEGIPNQDFPLLKIQTSLPEIIQDCITGEKASISIQTEAIKVASDEGVRQILVGMRNDEEGHLRLLQQIQQQL